MLKFGDSIDMPRQFGDFGGNDSAGDFDPRINPDIEAVQTVITSDEFEEKFQMILQQIVGEYEIKRIVFNSSRAIVVVPNLSKKYALAARIAYAKVIGKEAAAIGSGDREIIDAAVDAGIRNDLKIKVILDKKLSQDKEYVGQLRASGAEVDDTTCVRYFDIPYSYLEIPMVADLPAYTLQVEANYGLWPKPGLTGIFAGLYGSDLLERLEHLPETCVVPITTGTEALGIIKGFSGQKCRIVTVEELIAGENHMINAGAYSIATRSAKKEQANTVICPELVNLWRCGKVLRLGCDRVHEVSVSELADSGLCKKTARAVILAFEQLKCSELLVVEVE